MRMPLPSRYVQPRPAQVKRQVSNIRHLSPPLKGLSVSSKLTTGDPLTAPILKNFVVEDDRILSRAGFQKMVSDVDVEPVEQLIPYYGQPQRLAGALAHKLIDAQSGAVLADGFTSNDWNSTAFSNLGETDFTVMVNGSDGVWSWDGVDTIVKEEVTAPSSATWIVPDQFNVVVAHMNRLWFADSTNLAIYFLPLQQKDGEVAYIPLNAIFKRGGSIRAVATWTRDGGAGLDDLLVVFSTNGECAIYSGVDPDTDIGLIGIFRFDSPVTKNCVSNYGGDLYVLAGTGLLPLSKLLQSESEQLGKEDSNVVSLFREQATKYKDRPGWGIQLNPSSGRMFCNLPDGAPNRYRQLVRHMPRPVWSEFCHVPARSWGWIDPYLYFGDDKGSIYRMHPSFLNDDGKPIRVDVQMAWSQFGTAGIKHFKMLYPYIITDGDPRPYVDVRVDHDYSDPVNQPDITFAEAGAEWDVAEWDVDYWALGAGRAIRLEQGVAALGHVGGPRLVALISDCTFAISGWDVVFEGGRI